MDYYLFNNPKTNKYRLLGINKVWKDCFVAEFTPGTNELEKLYWGNNHYVEEDRYVISLMYFSIFLHATQNEWKAINLKLLQESELNLLLQKVEEGKKQK